MLQEGPNPQPATVRREPYSRTNMVLLLLVLEASNAAHLCKSTRAPDGGRRLPPRSHIVLDALHVTENNSLIS